MMSESNFPDGRALLERIKKDSEYRRHHPLKFFKEFLQGIWMDNLEEEAVEQWRVKVTHAPWYAEDALICMDAVILAPPPHLIEILQNDGWIGLYHAADENGHEAEYTFDEYIQWLKAMRDRFKSIYDSAQ